MKKAVFCWVIACSVFMGLALTLKGEANEAIPSAKDFFQVGEVLPYEVKWTGIPCGEIRISIEDQMEYRGEDVFHFKLTAESNLILSSFYKVQDRIESFAHAEELYSLRYIKQLNEGNYTKDQVVEYDPLAGQATYEEKSGKESIAVSQKAKDTLAAFYLFRMMDMEIGSQRIFEVDSNKKHYRLYVEAKEPEQIEIRNVGVFDTTRVEVDVVKMKGTDEGERTEKGIVLWMLDNPRRTPIRIRTQVFLGEIEMLLKPDQMDPLILNSNLTQKNSSRN